MNKRDKQLLRTLEAQIVVLLATDAPKPERYLAAADACDQVAARLRERAAAKR